MKSKLIFAAFLIICLIAPAFAFDDNTTVKIVYDGKTDIKDSLATKTSMTDKATTLAKASEAIMKDLTYPFKATATAVSETSKTEITITHSRYDEKINAMGYWITAYRDGQEVAVNNPIWIYPAPYQVVVSETYDEKANEVTVVLKEDPKLAAELILERHVATLPLGKTITGTKE